MSHYRDRPAFLISLLLICLLPGLLLAENSFTTFTGQIRDGRSVVLTDVGGDRMRLTPYGNSIIRVQAARRHEEFFPDDRYEMVQPGSWTGSLTVNETATGVELATERITVLLSRESMRLSFRMKAGRLLEGGEIWWSGDTIGTSFALDSTEHFTGLGHGYFGREESLDLRGRIAHRNYGSEHGQQAPLIIPFYLSSKGYGMFLNSTFPNSFNFGKDGRYEFSITGKGQMDFFVIAGPEFEKILDFYTQLTGRPRFPPRAIFGLGLSDKGNDETSSDPSDEKWWKGKITKHRDAGFPLDHIINDNRWRAGGGKRCESYFDWDSTRYPDPAEYENWVRSNGLIVTLDFNRCIASHSEGWRPEFNIPHSDSVEFGDSAPDFTRSAVRGWFWNLFWRKSINPDLHFPGDALWIDEFDELGKIPVSTVLGNGRTWGEMKNYWFFLIAKALVQEGWDPSFHRAKRPFVWVRGMTAGGQRYATLWSGDITPTYGDMKTQIRSMQLAGLSGFPFWGHDAGGFYDWKGRKGPDDTMYCRWSMAFGSFSPFWKPHGMGQSRWPLDRPPEVQGVAKKYCTLRYQLMPYLYTYAHQASETGMPIARAMVIDHQYVAQAWKSDLQYMWGNELLVAPNCSNGDSVAVWLPAGTWYHFRDEAQLNGDRVFFCPSPIGSLPLFVKAGSIIPMAPYALSTAFIPHDNLILHVYTGGDASFNLYEDDGMTEEYRNGEFRTTHIAFSQSTTTVTINGSQGTFRGAPSDRRTTIVLHGLPGPVAFEANGRKLKDRGRDEESLARAEGSVWNDHTRLLTLFIRSMPVTQRLEVSPVHQK